MQEFNAWLAVKITDGVATMWCAYAFAILALVGFPGFHADVKEYVMWFSQTFIQLTMLSILAVGQKTMTTMQERHTAHLEELHKRFDDLKERRKKR